MSFRRWSCVPVLVLVLALVALPVLAEERPIGQVEKSLFDVLVEALVRLVPAAAKLTDGIEASAPAGPTNDQTEPGPEGDLGSGLDPLG
jgi:hypothetical protein